MFSPNIIDIYNNFEIHGHGEKLDFSMKLLSLKWRYLTPHIFVPYFTLKQKRYIYK